MAAATVQTMEWGYRITGGTSATVINANKMWVSVIAFAGTSTAATALLTSNTNGGNVDCGKFLATQSATNISNTNISFGGKGCPFTNLTVTLSATTDILYVYLAF